MKKKCYVGVDIGGTQIKIGIVDSNTKILAQGIINTPSAEHLSGFLNPLADEIIQLVKRVKEDCGDNFAIKTVGVGAPGTSDSKSGEILYCNSIPVLSETKFAQELYKTLENKISRNFSIKDCFMLKSVQIGNDAKNAAIAELEKGSLSPARVLENNLDFKDKVIMFLTIGTGIGGAVIKNGEILFDKAEPGHTSLGNTVIENLASTQRGLVNMALEEIKQNRNSGIKKEWDIEINQANFEDRPTPKLDAKMIMKAYDKGDASAQRIFDKWIDNLSEGLKSLVNAYQAEYIVLGGGISNIGKKLTDPLVKQVNEKNFFSSVRSFNVKIIPAELRNDCGIIGSAMMAKNRERQLEQNHNVGLRHVKSAPSLEIM